MSQGYLEPQKLEETRKKSFSRAFRGSVAPPTPVLWTSGLQSCERINCCCFAWFMVICNGKPGILFLRLRQSLQSPGALWKQSLDGGPRGHLQVCTSFFLWLAHRLYHVAF